MILLFYAVVKIIKWTLITVAYVVFELLKLGVLLMLLIFMGCRGVVRRLGDTRGAKEPDELQGLYALQHGSRGVSRDSFDARWQRERDLRVAERQESSSARRATPVDGGGPGTRS